MSTNESGGISPTNQEPEIPIEKILKDCMDAPGYVICVARLYGGDNGEWMVERTYRRYHMGIEDVVDTVKYFKEQVIIDQKKLEEETRNV